jgi:hypothetical protein
MDASCGRRRYRDDGKRGTRARFARGHQAGLRARDMALLYACSEVPLDRCSVAVRRSDAAFLRRSGVADRGHGPSRSWCFVG